MKKPASAVGVDLPHGWSVKTVKRTAGATKGTVDKYYVSPGGTAFNSYKKALGHINGV